MTDDEMIIENFWQGVGYNGIKINYQPALDKLLKYAIKLARADESKYVEDLQEVAYQRGCKDEREKIKRIIADVSCDEDSRCLDDNLETYISLKALLKALEAQGE